MRANAFFATSLHCLFLSVHCGLLRILSLIFSFFCVSYRSLILGWLSLLIVGTSSGFCLVSWVLAGLHWLLGRCHCVLLSFLLLSNRSVLLHLLLLLLVLSSILLLQLVTLDLGLLKHLDVMAELLQLLLSVLNVTIVVIYFLA